MPPLTDRQRDLLARIATRAPLKQIARDLGCSESAINQRVKSLKRRLGVNSLPELASIHRNCPIVEVEAASDSETCRKTACSFSHIATDRCIDHSEVTGAATDPLTFQDAMTFNVDAPWTVRQERMVAPRALNGSFAVAHRTAVIVGITFLLFATTVLALSAGQVLTELVSG